MTPEGRTCEETTAGRQCGRRAAWLVGLDADGLYPACPEHARAWAADCRVPLGPTPLQWAIRLVLDHYAAALGLLTPAERDVLRDVIACRLARDYLADTGKLDELKERAA